MQAQKDNNCKQVKHKNSLRLHKPWHLAFWLPSGLCGETMPVRPVMVRDISSGCLGGLATSHLLHGDQLRRESQSPANTKTRICWSSLWTRLERLSDLGLLDGCECGQFQVAYQVVMSVVLHCFTVGKGGCLQKQDKAHGTGPQTELPS